MSEYNKHARVDLEAWDKGMRGAVNIEQIHKEYIEKKATTLEKGLVNKGFNIIEVRLIIDFFKEVDIDIQKIYKEKTTSINDNNDKQNM